MKPQKTENIERSSSGIRETLFREIEGVRAGRVTPQRAAAVANLCRQIIASAKLDIEFQRFVSEGQGDAPAKDRLALTSLTLVS